MKKSNGVYHILLVEDNPMDILMTKEGIQLWDVQNQLHIVEDGQAALDFLYRRGDYPDAQTPDLIILDLNLPKRSGTEVLKALRNEPELAEITVVVLTTSASEDDAERCGNLGVQEHLTKPLDFDDYVETIASLKRLVN